MGLIDQQIDEHMWDSEAVMICYPKSKNQTSWINWVYTNSIMGVSGGVANVRF